jgi:hypothetical protein
MVAVAMNREEAGHHRERVDGPLATLMRFIEQVLSVDPVAGMR